MFTCSFVQMRLIDDNFIFLKQEVKAYIDNIIAANGKFCYAPPDISYDPQNMQVYIDHMLGRLPEQTQFLDMLMMSPAVPQNHAMDVDTPEVFLNESSINDEEAKDDDLFSRPIAQSTPQSCFGESVAPEDFQSTSNISSELSTNDEEASLSVTFQGSSKEVGLLRYVAKYLGNEKTTKQNINNERNHLSETLQNAMQTKRQLQGEFESKEKENLELKEMIGGLKQELEIANGKIATLSTENATSQANIFNNQKKSS